MPKHQQSNNSQRIQDRGVITDDEYGRVVKLMNASDIVIDASVPETEAFVSAMITILQTLQDPTLVELKKSSVGEFKSVILGRLEKKIGPFIEKNYVLFENIIMGQVDQDILNIFIKVKYLVEKKQLQQKTADNFIMEYISRKFLYPTFGSKEEFQRAVLEEQERLAKEKKNN